MQSYQTQGGIRIELTQEKLDYQAGIDFLIERLNSQRGALFASSFEYPGRYTCWDVGFYNPPLVITCKENFVSIEALNKRGEILLAFIWPILEKETHLKCQSNSSTNCHITIQSSTCFFSEEERSRQPSVFTVIRLIIDLFKAEQDPYIGLYGAFGFDLVYQFEQLTRYKSREDTQRDMVLYLPDEIFVVNHRKEETFIYRYDFEFQGKSTCLLLREGYSDAYQPVNEPLDVCDHQPGEYAQLVTQAKEYFARGDLFEVVPSQTFYTHYTEEPAVLFRRMRELNPSPYGFFINLGNNEYLIGASPEMYVRVQGRRVETCPISGTVKRGQDAIEDAEQIKMLLMSEKEESELTMCTDVDRNDKSRICEAGSVRVVGRRQIEMYSRVIHTVDHVEGTLREEFDAVDAFLTHMWVVTVTGAPKLWALDFIEQQEKSPRKWYAGAVGWFGFDGNLNTGLVLRTIRLEAGIAEVRVGATLLYDSVPELEEEETRLKASAFLEILRNSHLTKVLSEKKMELKGKQKKVLLVDHQDSFVHTLANYFRQTGAEVQTIRFDRALAYLEQKNIDLIVLSPGPGRPEDFNLSKMIHAAISKNIPLFGVCLGLQGIVEYFGGSLEQLSYPMHGKRSTIKIIEPIHPMFSGLKNHFKAGRYHSLYANRHHLPSDLIITASTEDNIIMAVAHQDLAVYAVQFHPETILTMVDQAGLRIISNIMQIIGEK